MIIGLDIGGTHTDVVVIDRNEKLLVKYKTLTTDDLATGVEKALAHILLAIPNLTNCVKRICIGTTHATNAIIEASQLNKVGVIRLSGHYPTSIMPCFGWPSPLFKTVYAGCRTIDGGYECDSREIRPYNRLQAIEAAKGLMEEGAESFAVVGTFSPLKYDQELACAEDILSATGGKCSISLSHQIGGCGFIERENATILNAALKKAMENGFENLEKRCRKLGFTCPVYVTQNDGSLIDLERAIAFPLLTISSGPTNSFVGAGKITGLDNAIVVDIGGTSTDIGMVCNGFPRRSMISAQIGGVALNFPMPDVSALAIGGGSFVTFDPSPVVGPRSCGKALPTTAMVFGGDRLTMTDVAVKAGAMSIGQSARVKLSEADAIRVMDSVLKSIATKIVKMKGKQTDLPIVVVGGGANICNVNGFRCLIPEHGDVANAYGAALAEVSGSIDTVVSLCEREKMLQVLKEKAMEQAVIKGAESRMVRIVDLQVTPYHYMPGNLARVAIRASGKHA